MKFIFKIVIVLFICLISVSCRKHRTPKSISFRLLNPSKENVISTVDDIQRVKNSEDESISIHTTISNNNSQILRRIGYTLSYNKETKLANWVAWSLSAEHTRGPFSRKGALYYNEDGSVCGIGPVTSQMVHNPYIEDIDVELPRQTNEDWKGDLFEMSHGHLCPAGDNKWSKETMNQSFLLTNICPQNKNLNNGDWKTLEEKCRSWANKYGEIKIIAGPAYKNNMVNKTIGVNRIAVPDFFFKVVLCMNKKTKAIGFVYPNESNHHDIEHYIVSVDDVEELTGFDFFSELPDSIEDKVESFADITQW